MKYYIAENGKPVGPFEPQELLSHGLTVNSLVWCESMSTWQPAGEVAELASFLGGRAQQPAQQPYQQPYQQQPAQQPYQQQSYQQPYQQQPYQQQPYQQQPYQQPQYQQAYQPQQPVNQPRRQPLAEDYKMVNWLLLIGSVLCCCCVNPIAVIPAIIGVIYSGKTNTANLVGAPEAYSYSNTAKICAIITAALLLLGWIASGWYAQTIDTTQFDLMINEWQKAMRYN